MLSIPSSLLRIRPLVLLLLSLSLLLMMTSQSRQHLVFQTHHMLTCSYLVIQARQRHFVFVAIMAATTITTKTARIETSSIQAMIGAGPSINRNVLMRNDNNQCPNNTNNQIKQPSHTSKLARDR
jgi:hypothetical protein